MEEESLVESSPRAHWHLLFAYNMHGGGSAKTDVYALVTYIDHEREEMRIAYPIMDGPGSGKIGSFLAFATRINKGTGAMAYRKIYDFYFPGFQGMSSGAMAVILGVNQEIQIASSRKH